MYPTNQEFVNLLRKARWRQVDAANAMHLTTATVSRYCTGEVEVPPSSLDHLSRILGMRPDNPEFRQMHEGPVWLEPWQTEVLGVFGRLDANTRRRFTAAVRDMVDALLGAVQYRRPKNPPTDHPPDPVPSVDALINAAVIGVTARPAPSRPAASAGPPSSDPPRSGVSAPARAPARIGRTSRIRSASAGAAPREET